MVLKFMYHGVYSKYYYTFKTTKEVFLCMFLYMYFGTKMFFFEVS